MGPQQVIAVAKLIELALTMLQVFEVEVAHHFKVEGAMEAFVLTLSLRMIRTAMNDANAEPDQPQAEHGETIVAARAPRRSVIHQHFRRQSIAAESGGCSVGAQG